MADYVVTIGIPVYQVERYIRRTLESALAQLYPSIEFLVVDDGCTDGTMRVVHELKATHERGSHIRIVTHPGNLGVSEARNRIIAEARGRYLYFMDSDDVIRADTISLLMGEMERFGADVVFGSYEKMMTDGRRQVYQYPNQTFEGEHEFAIYAYRKFAGIQASACNYLVRLSIVRDSGLRFFKSDFWEDTVFTLQLVTHVRRVVLLSDITYTYMVRENSLSNSQDARQIAKSDIAKYFEAIETLKADGPAERAKPYFANRCYIALTADFFIICNVLKKRHYMQDAFTAAELMGYLHHPATLAEICSFRSFRLHNLAFYIIGHLPPRLGVCVIRQIARIKGFI